MESSAQANIRMLPTTKPQTVLGIDAAWTASKGSGVALLPVAEKTAGAAPLEGRGIDYPSRHGNVTFKRVRQAIQETHPLGTWSHLLQCLIQRRNLAFAEFPGRPLYRGTEALSSPRPHTAVATI